MEDKTLDEIRLIMRDWEGFFPFPDAEDAGTEAEIAYSTAKKILAWHSAELDKAVKVERDKCEKQHGKINLYVGGNPPILCASQPTNQVSEGK